MQLKEIIKKVIMLVFVLITCLPTIVGAADIDKLIPVLIAKESGGNDWAIGDKNLKDKAYGCLQIRQMCVDDVNRLYGTNIRSEDMLGNRSLSMWVCQKYLGIYATKRRLGREPTFEDMARIWNGGPGGWKRPSTISYASDVRSRMDRLNSNPSFMAKSVKTRSEPTKVALSKNNLMLIAKN